jgi:hypothetical protein
MERRRQGELERTDYARICATWAAAGIDRDYLGFYDIDSLSRRGKTVDEIIDIGLALARKNGDLQGRTV